MVKTTSKFKFEEHIEGVLLKRTKAVVEKEGTLHALRKGFESDDH